MLVEEDMEKVNKWGKGLERKLTSYEEMKIEMEKSRQKFSFVKNGEAKRLEEQLNKEKPERKIAVEVKIEEAKQKKILEHEKKIAEEQAKEEREKEIKAKLFKVEITKFNGTHLGWIRFWIQYEAKIDKSKLSAVAKVFIFKRACNIESESFDR